MSIFYFLAAYLLTRRLIKRYKMTAIFPKWRSLLVTTSWVVIVAYFALFSVKDGLDHLIGAGMLLGMLQYVERERDFAGQKNYVKANYPLVAVGFINGLAMLLASKFYNSYEEWFQGVTLAAF